MSVFKKFNGKRVKHGDANYNRGTWYMWFRVRDGRIIHRSIPEAKTLTQAKEAEAAVKLKIFENKYKYFADTTLFSEFVNDVYLNYVEQHNKNPKSKQTHIKALVEHFGKRQLKDITPQDCRNYQAKRLKSVTTKGEIRSASTVNRELTTLSKIFNLAIQENKIERNPMQFVGKSKEPASRNRILSEEEFQRFLEEVQKDKILYRLYLIAVNTGLRKGQIVALKVEDIDLDKRVLKAIASKGQPERLIPLNQTMCDHLSEMIFEVKSGNLFPLVDFRKRWAKAIKNAGIKDFRFHDLKHFFGTNLIQAGVNPLIVQMLFAHSSQEMTNRYLHPGFELLREAVGQLDNVQSFEKLQ